MTAARGGAVRDPGASVAALLSFSIVNTAGPLRAGDPLYLTTSDLKD